MSFDVKIDPDAVLDYKINWNAPVSSTNPKGPWLAEGETITDFEITSTSGITVDSSTEDDGIVTVWVSGATPRVQRVTCHITTSAGRQEDATIKFTVTDR